jgi:hypothetical protein
MLLAGCGTPGAPVVPSLQLPQPPSDLVAARKGDRVTLTWTAPQLTTDNQTIRERHAGPTIICRAASATPAAGCQAVGESPAVIPVPPTRGHRRGPRTPQVQYVDTLPKELEQAHPAGFAQYAVEARNSRGRVAGMSNQVMVPLAPAPAPPTELSMEVTAAGVVVYWCPAKMPVVPGLSYTAHAYRQEVSAPTGAKPGSAGVPNAARAVPPIVLLAGEPVAAGKHPCSHGEELLDRSFEWEKQYRYWVAGVTKVNAHEQTLEVEGDDSVPVTVLTHDVFPPAVPEGIEAVASGVGQQPFIDLTWRPDTDADLAGYYVYRQQADGSWVKLNAAPVPVPAFRDDQVKPGERYSYTVSAVDVRGNESGRSAAASETLP